MMPPMPIGTSAASQMSRSVGGQRARDIVERDDLFALLGQPHDETAAAERVEVVRMVRLVALEHDVVADVDDVVQRPHAGCTQADGASSRATGRRRRR